MGDPTEENQLERNRYLNVTATCRDMPFATVIVLEQPHMHDFLVQLANSQLRIQITQVHFTRVRTVAPLSVVGAAPGTASPADLPDPNLVEMTVYGIAALYEKFSTKKPDELKQPGKP